MLCRFTIVSREAAEAWNTACSEFLSKTAKKEAIVEAVVSGPALAAVSASLGSLAAHAISNSPAGGGSDGVPAISLPPDALQIVRRLVNEVLRHVVAGTIAPLAAVKLLTDSTPKFASLGAAGAGALCDAAWLIGMEIEDGESLGLDVGADWKKSQLFTRFRTLLHGLVSAGLVAETALKERLELSMLEACGFIRSAEQFKKAVVRVNTKLKYQQHKYNLLAEDCEGYGKLITEFLKPLTAESVPSIVKNMRMLIGYFRLDPNRVLDILLDAFEMVHR
jgi:hypothetical protein